MIARMATAFLAHPTDPATDDMLGGLCELLAVVDAMAGVPGDPPPLPVLRRATNGIAERRYDALVAEAVGIAETGVDALLRLRRAGRDPAPAAAQLASDLRRAHEALAAVLNP